MLCTLIDQLYNLFCWLFNTKLVTKQSENDWCQYFFQEEGNGIKTHGYLRGLILRSQLILLLKFKVRFNIENQIKCRLWDSTLFFFLCIMQQGLHFNTFLQMKITAIYNLGGVRDHSVLPKDLSFLLAKEFIVPTPLFLQIATDSF